MADDDAEDQPLNIGQMEISMLRCVCRLDSVLGRPSRTPEDMDDLEIAGYRDATIKVINYAEAHEQETMDLGMLAAMAHAAFLDFTDQPAAKFDAIAPALQQKWRYLVKHLWNLMGYDASEDGAVQKHEEQIEAQFRDVLEKQSLIAKG